MSQMKLSSTSISESSYRYIGRLGSTALSFLVFLNLLNKPMLLLL